MTRTCVNCSKEFTTKHSISKYCSRDCFRSRNKNLTTRFCLECGKQLKTYPNWIKRGGGKFCSWSCRNIHKRNRIERLCEICGKTFKVKPVAIKNSGAKYCSHICMWKGQKGKEKPSIQGKLNYNWKNGASRQQYPLKFNDDLKESIRKRDDYTCQLCKLHDEEHILVYGYNLMVHHIDYIKENCENNNLVSLCNQCHGRTNYNRAYWTQFFVNKLKERCDEKAVC